MSGGEIHSRAARKGSTGDQDPRHKQNIKTANVRRKYSKQSEVYLESRSILDCTASADADSSPAEALSSEHGADFDEATGLGLTVAVGAEAEA